MEIGIPGKKKQLCRTKPAAIGSVACSQTRTDSMKDLLARLNPAFDHRNRMGIMAVLAGEEWVEYNTLKELLNLTDGNLASHLKALESGGYICVRKEFIGRRPQTTYGVTGPGRSAFRLHLAALEDLVRAGKDG
jgi:DNA-binding transcriptional ArsR family regulator